MQCHETKEETLRQPRGDCLWVAAQRQSPLSAVSQRMCAARTHTNGTKTGAKPAPIEKCVFQESSVRDAACQCRPAHHPLCTPLLRNTDMARGKHAPVSTAYSAFRELSEYFPVSAN